MFTLSLAVVLGLLDWRVTRRNMGAPYNGYGALGGTLWRVNASPMRGRVLMAWLVGWLPEPARVVAYLVAKWGLCWGVLAVYASLAGPVACLVLAGLIACTLTFDYWDGYAELLGICLCLTGRPGAAVVGSVVWGLSRETVLLAPVLAWPWGLVGVLVRGLTMVWQGAAPLYCERWTLRALNVPDVKAMWRRLDDHMLMSLLWTVATPIVMLGSLPEPFARTAWAPAVWIVAGWLLARARETRVFLPAALWLAAGIGGRL